MKIKALLVMAMVMAGTASVRAQPDVKMDVTREPGKATATGTARTTARIVKIDAATRTVSLKRKDGHIVDLVVGEEAKKFDQLKVGDVVTVEYKEALSLSLKKGSGPLSMHEREISEPSAPGASPGGAVRREVTATADVVAVNAAAKTVTLKGPKGHTADVKIEDPDQLKGIKKGDRVEAVYTEALAVSVEPGAGK